MLWAVHALELSIVTSCDMLLIHMRVKGSAASACPALSCKAQETVSTYAAA